MNLAVFDAIFISASAIIFFYTINKVKIINKGELAKPFNKAFPEKLYLPTFAFLFICSVFTYFDDELDNGVYPITVMIAFLNVFLIRTIAYKLNSTQICKRELKVHSAQLALSYFLIYRIMEAVESVEYRFETLLFFILSIIFTIFEVYFIKRTSFTIPKVPDNVSAAVKNT